MLNSPPLRWYVFRFLLALEAIQSSNNTLETECGYCFITIKILPFKGTKVRDV